MHVAVAEEGHCEECTRDAGAVVPAQALVEFGDRFGLVALAEIFHVGVVAVMCDHQFRERGCGEGVGEDEGQVACYPDCAREPVAADGVDMDAVVVDFKV